MTVLFFFKNCEFDEVDWSVLKLPFFERYSHHFKTFK